MFLNLPPSVGDGVGMGVLDRICFQRLAWISSYGVRSRETTCPYRREGPSVYSTPSVGEAGVQGRKRRKRSGGILRDLVFRLRPCFGVSPAI
jgi:hypothetical protein